MGANASAIEQKPENVRRKYAKYWMWSCCWDQYLIDEVAHTFHSQKVREKVPYIVSFLKAILSVQW